MKIKIAISMLHAAEKYLERGWSVIPVKNKKPITKWTPFQKRHATEKECRRWFKNKPVNIAVVTGEFSGLAVLDIDARNNGHESLRMLEKEFGKLPPTAEVETGGGGRHIYFKHPGFYVKSRAIAPGVEIKGDGGSVTCPPSLHGSGKRYRWKAPPDEVGIAEMPDWLTKLVSEKTREHSSIDGGAVIEGSRNETLTSLAGTLRNRGLTEEQLLPVLDSLNKAICNPPLAENEISLIAKSIGKYDSAALIPSKASERKYITGVELREMQLPKLEWIWPDYIAKTLVTIMSAYPKVGKTTLLRLLIRDLLQHRSSGFLGRSVLLRGKILVLSEEPPILFKDKAEELGLLRDELLILFRSKIDAWPEALAQVAKAINDSEVELVVIDTLAEFWDAKDENDAPNVIRSLKLLKKIAHDHSVGILILHHTRKGGGDGGEAHRGSSAIPGAVDIAVELRPDKSSDKKRVLITRSRVGNVPDHVIELVGEDYVSLGSADQHKRESVEQRVIEILPGPKDKPISRDEIMNKLNPKPSDTLLKEILAGHIEIEKIGKGRKGSPLKYRRKAKKTVSSKAQAEPSKFKDRLSKAQERWPSATAKAKRGAKS